jgi:apolipoprotein N-acyltransferase
LATNRLLLFFILSGFLLGLSFPATGGLTFLIFFAFIPMLIAEQSVYEKRLRARKVLWLSYPGFIVFNALSTWWIVNASVGGVIMAVFLNAFIMSFYFWIYHLVHRRYGNYWGHAAFVSLWMSFEYIHYHWELSWPWLNFGNAFATKTAWIQWYEYTGVGGGTLWVLLVNLIGFYAVQRIYFKKMPAKKNIFILAAWLILIFVPLFISLKIYNGYTEKKDPIDVVVVQPNINPYGDKFENMSGEEQMVIFLRNAFMVSDTNVDYIVGPETALPYSIDEKQLAVSGEVELLFNAFSRMPKTGILIGMSSHNYYKPGEKHPENAREDEYGNFSEFYNSALFINTHRELGVYHKSKLVLGVEKIPFTGWLPFLENFALELGGTSGTLGIEKEPIVFSEKGKRAVIAPSVCYESIFGEYMGQFTQKGANVLFVITNDGWWDDTPGYKQHINFNRLTAISLRRSIAQSANTGISGFIDQRGDIIKHTNWWEPTALRQKINLNSTLTFYAAHGDILYRLSIYFSIAFVLLYVYAYVAGKTYVKRGEV